MDGHRLPIPPRDQLPGPDTARFAGLDAYIALMQRCWLQVGPGLRAQPASQPACTPPRVCWVKHTIHVPGAARPAPAAALATPGGLRGGD